MNRKLFLNYRLSAYSLAKIFNEMQIMLPKMKRKASRFINSFFLNYRLSAYSLARIFNEMQIMLPKMKRRSAGFINDFLLLSKPHSYMPVLTVTPFSIDIFGDLI